ncbi:Csu type fimbrial protein [Phyllobacterium myrsinacearum]|nr:spore coat U domain-containing protein [Phyllobacterium myrsinacearum]PWV86619.1 spore coat protein U-like protein [Phyllobacterium myrsinacearum]RZU97393.1 spore coat protein U-like protein [Phyllobacterium myrsinacearum]
MKIFVPVLAMSALLASTVAGWSAPATGTLQVKLTIAKECKVVSSNAILTFDSTKVSAAGNIEDDTGKNGAIEVQCTRDTTYKIALGEGENYENGSRRMKTADGKNFVAYVLYSDSKRERPWGSVDKALGVNDPLTGTNARQSYPVYGRVFMPKAGIAAGDYADTVTVTVEF